MGPGHWLAQSPGGEEVSCRPAGGPKPHLGRAVITEPAVPGAHGVLLLDDTQQVTAGHLQGTVGEAGGCGGDSGQKCGQSTVDSVQ